MAKITKNKNNATVKFSRRDEGAVVFSREGVEILLPREVCEFTAKNFANGASRESLDRLARKNEF